MNNTNSYRSSFLELLKLEKTYVNAKGDFLTDDSGHRFYDALSQYGTLIFGHNNDELVASLNNYCLNDSPNFIQPNYSVATTNLTKGLKSMFCGAYRHVCFTNSGAESVEAAIKLARLKTRKNTIISLTNSFHGKTYSALSASGSNRYKMSGIYDEHAYVNIPIGDIESLENHLALDNVAAFIFEPVLGEGGMELVDPEFIRKAISLCKKHRVITIADEIQCGLFRCGNITVSSCQQYEPEIVLLGKGLSGGLVPIGAVLYSKSIYTKEFEKIHSSTFAGGGLASSVALCVIDRLTIDSDLIFSIRKLSQRIDCWIERLAIAHKYSIRITGIGLMRSVQFCISDSGQNYFTNYIKNSGMLSYLICSYLLNVKSIYTMPLLSCDNAIRFEPALNTSDIGIDEFFQSINDISLLLENGRYDVLLAHLVGMKIDSPDSKIYPTENRDIPFVNTVSDCDVDFAFLIHTTSEEDLIKILPLSIRKQYSKEKQYRLVRLFISAGNLDPNPAVCYAFELEGPRRKVRGALVFSPITAESMIRLPKIEKEKLLDEYISIATQCGAKLIGLGAYTSVISRGGSSLVNKYSNLQFTTGNGLTSIAIAGQFKEIYKHQEDSRIAVIGSRGSVGRALTSEIFGYVSKITLVGRKNTSLASYQDFIYELIESVARRTDYFQPYSLTALIKKQVSERWKKEKIFEKLCGDKGTARISVRDDIEACIRESDYIVSCTSEGKAFLDDSRLKKTAFVLDGGRPFDFLRSSKSNAKIIEAGLVVQPHGKAYGDCNLAIDDSKENLACFSETILLAFSEIRSNYSIGKKIDLNEIDKLSNLSQHYGYLASLSHTSKLAEDRSEALEQ
jgi:acetylornithine/succinyldiaminopimelate/putrescine aminotransferase/predicted amino acid dehydrogenase